ncbi:MAG: hypothetical protein ACYC26_07875 [Phycisphaerales bacterium]
MRRIHVMVWVMMCVSAAYGESQPEEGMVPGAGLVGKCERYYQAMARYTLAVSEDLRFGEGAKEGWKLPAGSQGRAGLRRVDGRQVLAFRGLSGGNALLTVGSPVTGAFAVEVRAKMVSGRPCDISIFCDGVEQGLGFQFGGYMNTRNLLWTDAKAEGQDKAYRAADLPHERLIVPGRWHTVRLVVEHDRESGWVDGKMIGETALSAEHDAERAMTLNVYTYNNEILIDRVTVYRLTEGGGQSAEQAWTEAFGAMSRDEVTAGLRKLGGLLDDEDWATRQAAQSLLERAGELARPVAEELEKNGTLEQRWRAKQIMRTMGTGE